MGFFSEMQNKVAREIKFKAFEVGKVDKREKDKKLSK